MRRYTVCAVGVHIVRPPTATATNHMQNVPNVRANTVRPYI